MNSKKIIKFLKQQHPRGYRKRELFATFNLPKKEYIKFRKTLKGLISRGEIIKGGGGRLTIPDENSMFTGILSISKIKNGYIPHENFGNVDVGGGFLNGALAGDTVNVQILSNYKNRPQGRIVDILKYNTKLVHGTVFFRRGRHYLETHKFISPRPIVVNMPHGKKFSPDTIIEAEIIDRGRPSHPVFSKFVKDIGSLSNPNTDYSHIVDKFSLRDEFPAQCLLEAEELEKNTDFNNFENRKDFTKLDTVTIDPDSARDYDDALSLKNNKDGSITVFVHIADVSHFVKVNSAIDKEAKLRGTSVYFVDQNIPMIPPTLTSNLCSLLPEKNRFTLTAIIDLDQNLNVTHLDVKKGVINSNIRLTYTDAQAILDNGEGENFTLLNDLRIISAKLRKNRFNSGSLNIEIPEAEFTMGNDGVPSKISVKKHLKTHELVEDFMLLANRVIAQKFSENDKSLMFRNHGKPEAERLISLNGLLAQLGDYKPLSITQAINASEFQRVLDKVADSEARHMIEIQLLRTMPKADYSLINKGHFGLNFEHYCHFTSPIRRYPDIMVHRVLSDIQDEDAGKIASSSTQSEITAMKAEREYNKIKQLRYLQELPPQIYSGIVNGMTQRGLFIMLEDILVDGFVRAEWMKDDYYYFDENRYVFIGRRYKTTYRVGQKVQVEIKKISVIKQKLDLQLVD